MRARWLSDSPTELDAARLDVQGPEGNDVDTATLAQHGVLYQRLPTTSAGYQPGLDALRAERGYITQDEIQLSPQTENLDAICAKFIPEHRHDDDEVRFVLEGKGVFDIRGTDDRYLRVVVEPGDLIVVPKDRNHRFLLTSEKHIRCVRLFRDKSGWIPHYRAAPAIAS
jgi:1,2-dihydroxy-3-keto-5-methylthiopentene dioxygenase